MQIDLSKKSVLVTGASTGIGLAISHLFAEFGAHLTMLAETESIHDAAAEVKARSGMGANSIVCDISDRAAVAKEIGHLEHLDVLVNNAGIERFVPILDPHPKVEEDFRRVLEVNLFGNFFITREAVPKMRNGGRIIFTSSVWGKTAVAHHSAYCASKHGIIGMMRSLSRELGSRGITVNVVCPGWTETEMAMANLHRMAELEEREPDALLREQISVQSIESLMKPRDIAGIYLFLATELAASITGQAISVDRGEHLA